MNRRPPQPYRLRFGIGTLLLVMIVISVASAGVSYIVQAGDNPGWQQLVFILFTLAAPVILVVLVSFVVWVTKWLNRR